MEAGYAATTLETAGAHPVTACRVSSSEAGAGWIAMRWWAHPAAACRVSSPFSYPENAKNPARRPNPAGPFPRRHHLVSDLLPGVWAWPRPDR